MSFSKPKVICIETISGRTIMNIVRFSLFSQKGELLDVLRYDMDRREVGREHATSLLKLYQENNPGAYLETIEEDIVSEYEKRFSALCTEYQEWASLNGLLDRGDAYETLSTDITPDQRKYINDFIARWEAADLP